MKEKSLPNNLKKEYLKKAVILVTLLILLRLLLVFFDNTNIFNGFLSHFSQMVCNIHKIFNFTCTVQNNVIIYDSLVSSISMFCLGFDQVFFILILLFVFHGTKNKKTNKEILLICLGVFILNLMRILLFYPLSNLVGVTHIQSIHDFLYYYGQGIFLIIIFVSYTYYKMRLLVKKSKTSNNSKSKIKSKKEGKSK